MLLSFLLSQHGSSALLALGCTFSAEPQTPAPFFCVRPDADTSLPPSAEKVAAVKIHEGEKKAALAAPGQLSRTQPFTK